MQEGLFTLAKLDDFVPPDHPLRAIHALVNEALVGLNGLFNTIYAETGRASIAPEKLLRAMLIQVLFSVRSERQLMEQVRYNLLFRWFIGLAIDDEVWDHSVVSKTRDRLLEHAVLEGFFAEVMKLADKRKLLSKEHFSVDGTLIQAWASHKSFLPKDGNGPGAGGGTTGRDQERDWKVTRLPAMPGCTTAAVSGRSPCRECSRRTASGLTSSGANNCLSVCLAATAVRASRHVWIVLRSSSTVSPMPRRYHRRLAGRILG
jgi:transposase